MFKNFLYLYNRIIDYFLYKALKKKLKKHVGLYPNISARVFDIINLKINLSGRFENLELTTLRKKVFNKINSKKFNALDIGANIGNHSVFFADDFLQVYSFEPLTQNFDLLKINSKLKKNITVFNVAASDKDESKIISFPSAIDFGHSKIVEDGEFIDNQSENIQAKNLDIFLRDNNIGKIKFIKIDVEGFEFRVLKGLKDTLQVHKPVVAFEQFPSDFKNDSTNSINFLKNQNYNYFYEPVFKDRKKNDNKVLNAANKILYFLIIIFSKKKEFHDLKKIKKFEVKPYPMIIASVDKLD